MNFFRRKTPAALLAAFVPILHLYADSRSQTSPKEARPAGIEMASLRDREPLPDGATLFRSLPSKETGVDFQMQLPDMARRSHELLHLSVMGGVCAGDYDGDGLPDFYVTSPQGGNRLFRNLGGFRFEDATRAAGVESPGFWGTGASFADVDNDGDLDIYACGYLSPNRLYINQGLDSRGVTVFQEEAARFGLDFNGASMSMAFADADLDGDLDAYLATTARPPPPGLKFQVEFEDGKPVVPEALREYWALLYLPGDRAHRTEAGQYDRFYRNENGRYIERASLSGMDGAYFTLGSIWWDCNEDGWPDLYVANDYLGSDQLYINQGDGTFSESIKKWMPHTPWSSMGMNIGDLNNDGHVDLIATDMLGTNHYRRNVMLGQASGMAWFYDFAAPPQYARNAVFVHSGANRMMETAYHSGMAATDWTWGPVVEDFDEDGRLDVLYANGMLRDVQHADMGNYADRTFGGGSKAWAQFWKEQPLHKETNLAFRNLGDMRFQEVGEVWGFNETGVSFASAAADFDRDGDLDLVVSHADKPISVFENRSAVNRRIQVRLRARRGNRFGLGATIRIVSEGRAQIRYLTGTRGWLSGSEPFAHFGLGGAESVEQLTVEWPGGARQTFSNLPVDHELTIVEPEADGATANPVKAARTETLFDVLDPSPSIEDVASEAELSPVQPLAPYRMDQARFCMAWGDIDGDGDQDLFLGGGEGIPGRVFIQSMPGVFQKRASSALNEHARRADDDARFLDADNDGDLDLFVAGRAMVSISAGNGSRDGLTSLYLNDGTGLFEKSAHPAPALEASSFRCLAVGDADGDGDVDLFLGGGDVPGRYPEAAVSRLWINHGGGFADETPAAFNSIGLANDAAWADLNNDGREDLVVATELGPIRLFMNLESGWMEKTEEAGFSQRPGWWRAIAFVDADGDGDLDLAAGNIGTNTKYQATLEQPRILFHGLFDESNEPRVLEAYYENGKLYPHRGFEALSRAIPELRARYLNFHQWSQASLDEMFEADKLQAATRLRWNTMESGVWIQEENGRFRFVPFPSEVQWSPVNDIAVGDFDSDGSPDLLLAQNDLTLLPATGRMDGGLGWLLAGQGGGMFRPVWPGESGLVVPGEARHCDWIDLNGDNRLDAVFGVRGGDVRIFLRRADP